MQAVQAAAREPESLQVPVQASQQAPVQVQELRFPPVPAPPQQQEALLFPAESWWKALQLQ